MTTYRNDFPARLSRSVFSPIISIAFGGCRGSQFVGRNTSVKCHLIEGLLENILLDQEYLDELVFNPAYCLFHLTVRHKVNFFQPLANFQVLTPHLISRTQL